MNTLRMRWSNKSKDALPPFEKMKWLLAVAWVALHNQSIREVLEAWSFIAFGHVFNKKGGVDDVDIGVLSDLPTPIDNCATQICKWLTFADTKFFF